MRAEMLEFPVLVDAAGAIVANLAQQDVVAVRVVAGDAETVLVVDRVLIERGGVVRVAEREGYGERPRRAPRLGRARGDRPRGSASRPPPAPRGEG